MRQLLITLDFPPEQGGIQRYLSGRVSHTYGPLDGVWVGAYCGGGYRYGNTAVPYPCEVTLFANPLSRLDKKWSVITLAARLLFTRKAGQGTIVECGNIFAAIAPFMVSLIRPRPYRVYAYGTELLCLRNKPRSAVARLFKKILQRADAIVAIGRYVSDIITGAGITTPIAIEPPRIDLPYSQLPQKKTRTDHSAFRLLSVGRLVPHKGHAVLLSALALLPHDIRWNLVIVGSGPEESFLRQHSGELKISDRIICKPSLEDDSLAREYESADLLVFPSIERRDGAEGFGIVLLEAAARGLPIIASRTGGVTEVLDNGACGWLVEPGSPQALAAAIASLAHDTQKRADLAQRAFTRVKEHYAW